MCVCVCVCVSYVALHAAVVHGWVKAERQIINPEEETCYKTVYRAEVGHAGGSVDVFVIVGSS